MLCHTLAPDLLGNSQQGAQVISALHLHYTPLAKTTEEGKLLREKHMYWNQKNALTLSLLFSHVNYRHLLHKGPSTGLQHKAAWRQRALGEGILMLLRGVHPCSLLTLIFGFGPSFSFISTWLTSSADHRPLFFQLSQPHSLWSCLLVPSGPPESSCFCFPKTITPSSLFLLCPAESQQSTLDCPSVNSLAFLSSASRPPPLPPLKP